MEKRLFYRDPSTGIESPLLIFQDDIDAIENVSTTKQNKIDPSINSASHDVVTTINELNWRAQHTMVNPEEPGVYKQVLEIDASGNYSWQDKQENLPVFEIQTISNPWTVGTVDFGTFDERDFMTFLAKTPVGNNASGCTINGEPVTMNHVAIGANTLVPNKLYLCTHESEDARYDFVEIHNMTNIVHNLTTNLNLQDSSDGNIYTYSKDFMNDFFDAIKEDAADTRVLLGDVSKFDPWSAYVKDDYVKYDGSVYRCNVEKVNGLWDPSQWVETDMMQEIFYLRGGYPIYVEIVTVKLIFSNGHEPFTGDASVTISYPEETGRASHTYNLTYADDYTVQFFVEHGETYYVQGNAVAGFVTPSRITNLSEKRKRTVNVLYNPVGSGIYIIDNEGKETDYTLWDPVNNPTACFVELTNSTLYAGDGKPDNSIVIGKTAASRHTNRQFCIENHNFTTLPDITNYATAALDYNGYINCSSIYADCSIVDASGYTCIDRYNKAHVDDPGFVPVTVDTYLPALFDAKDITEILQETPIHGYIPSFGQLKLISLNATEINAALALIDAEVIDFGNNIQKYSSTEYGETAMVGLYNLNNNAPNKTGNASRNTIILLDLWQQKSE